MSSPMSRFVEVYRALEYQAVGRPRRDGEYRGKDKTAGPRCPITDQGAFGKLEELDAILNIWAGESRFWLVSARGWDFSFSNEIEQKVRKTRKQSKQRMV
jgi:hypothetical protein